MSQSGAHGENIPKEGQLVQEGGVVVLGSGGLQSG